MTDAKQILDTVVDHVCTYGRYDFTAPQYPYGVRWNSKWYAAADTDTLVNKIMWRAFPDEAKELRLPVPPLSPPLNPSRW